jgi:DNA modification methylase
MQGAHQIEKIGIEKLIPYAKNSRTHSDEQVAQIAASIKEFGFNNPVLIGEDDVIIAGHGRVMAARKIGLMEVPCIRLGHLTETQRKAYIIADNRLALNAGWDNELLTIELNELLVDNFALDILGFDVDELKNLLDPVKPTEGLTDEDEVPEVPEEPKTKPGDIYRLGKHRLMCGDSTSIDAVEKLMDGQKADVVFTSPPYNANTKVGNVCIFTSKKSKKLYDEGFSDNLESSEYVDFASSVLENCFLVTNGFIFWNVSYNANSRFEYIQQIYGRLPFLIEQICWKKSSTIPFKGSLMRDWEPIYLFSTNKEKLGLEDVVSNHWAISNTNSQTENHKACFPVELPEKGINLIKVKTGIVFEPFAGSGSTMIACQKLGRTNFSMELDPKYCDVIVKRWEDFTGQKAELLN